MPTPPLPLSDTGSSIPPAFDTSTDFDPSYIPWGSFGGPSSLDRHETNVGPAKPENKCPVTFDQPFVQALDPDATAKQHQDFRHGFWKTRRASTRQSMILAGQSPKAVERFDSCGSSIYVMARTDGPREFRLSSNRCRNRWCEACQVEHRRLIAGNLAAYLSNTRVRLLTLTLAAADSPLSEQIARMYKSFRKFRQRAAIAAILKGGIFFLEVTYNHRLNRWHPHLHILFSGGYLPHEVAKREWHDITGDSYIVDIRDVGDGKRAGSYVAKYASKSIDVSVWSHSEQFREAIAALAGRRTFQTFGDWSKCKLSKSPELEGEWTCWLPLWRVIELARSGDLLANAAWSRIGQGRTLPVYDLPSG